MLRDRPVSIVVLLGLAPVLLCLCLVLASRGKMPAGDFPRLVGVPRNGVTAEAGFITPPT